MICIDDDIQKSVEEPNVILTLEVWKGNILIALKLEGVVEFGPIHKHIMKAELTSGIA